jgi:hypothetical protein
MALLQEKERITMSVLVVTVPVSGHQIELLGNETAVQGTIIATIATFGYPSDTSTDSRNTERWIRQVQAGVTLEILPQCEQ